MREFLELLASGLNPGEFSLNALEISRTRGAFVLRYAQLGHEGLHRIALDLEPLPLRSDLIERGARALALLRCRGETRLDRGDLLLRVGERSIHRLALGHTRSQPLDLGVDRAATLPDELLGGPQA